MLLKVANDKHLNETVVILWLHYEKRTTGTLYSWIFVEKRMRAFEKNVSTGAVTFRWRLQNVEQQGHPH